MSGYISLAEVLSTVLEDDDSDLVRNEVEYVAGERYAALEEQCGGPPFELEPLPEHWRQPLPEHLCGLGLEHVLAACPRGFMPQEAASRYRRFCDELNQVRRLAKLEERLEQAARQAEQQSQTPPNSFEPIEYTPELILHALASEADPAGIKRLAGVASCSQPTVKKWLPVLRDQLKYAKRPVGSKQGHIITELGRQYLEWRRQQSESD